ncbi:hypothetical protein GCM10022380_80140 [Amycolatopsis tucumanensis]|uniref:Uncharacterized protein n=1 Tax=Amycolatopsis tucumanensis TaxID=401106 RepID=A0ABP7JPN2_9PSEU
MTGSRIRVSDRVSASVKGRDRHRSRNAQTPNRSANTTDATSATPCRLSISRQSRLRAGLPPVAVCRVATAPGRRAVQRLTGVRYLSRIRRGSSGRHGTSASGAVPTAVSGSVSGQA